MSTEADAIRCTLEACMLVLWLTDPLPSIAHDASERYELALAQVASGDIASAACTIGGAASETLHSARWCLMEDNPWREMVYTWRRLEVDADENLRHAVALRWRQLLGITCDAGALRNRVADWIEGHPETHDQMEWGDSDCGTPCCVAGWARRIAQREEELPSVRDMSTQVLGAMLLAKAGAPLPSFHWAAQRPALLAALRGGT